MKNLFQSHSILSAFLTIILSLFSKYNKQTVSHIVYMILGILTMNGCVSIRSLYNFFFSKYSKHKFKSFYYLLNNSQLDTNDLLKSLAQLALTLIPEQCTLPVFFIIDDTLTEKFGEFFEFVGRLHDHAKHNGTEYLHGHCFVCLSIVIPVEYSKGKYKYIRIPLGFRMWTPLENSSKYSKKSNKELNNNSEQNNNNQKSKLEIAVELMELLYPIIGTERKINVLADSWYAKGIFLDFIKKHRNVEAVINVRIDTVLYDLPPQEEKRRGRPRKKGKKLSIDKDFSFIDVPNCDFQVAHKKVLTNLFGLDCPVFVMITKTKTGNSKRLYLCTNPKACEVDDYLITDKNYKAIIKKIPSLLGFASYTFRWSIEICFYELKMFWGFNDYKLRSKTGIERLINLETFTYSLLSMFPYLNSAFKIFEDLSIQERRQKLGSMILEQFFLTRLTDLLEDEKNLSDAQSCKNFLRDLDLYEMTG